MLLILEGIFVLRGLPCFNAGQHYQNCLLLKIRFSFCVLCLVTTITISSFMLIYELRNLLMLTIPILSFVILKLCMQYLIYEPLKYKDDGRDVVSVADFFTIHVTFSAINAWITYQMYYCIMVTFATLCDTKLFPLYDSGFCIQYRSLKGYDKHVVYWYNEMVPLSIIVFAFLFVEASVNLTYYRDCVFSSTVFCIYMGMLWVSVEFKMFLTKHCDYYQAWKDDTMVGELALEPE